MSKCGRCHSCTALVHGPHCICFASLKSLGLPRAPDQLCRRGRGGCGRCVSRGHVAHGGGHFLAGPGSPYTVPQRTAGHRPGTWCGAYGQRFVSTVRLCYEAPQPSCAPCVTYLVLSSAVKKCPELLSFGTSYRLFNLMAATTAIPTIGTRETCF